MTEKDKTLVHLPGTRLTPDMVLHRTLDNVGRIKNVIVIVQWDDDTFVVDYSSMKVSEMCMASMYLSSNISDVIREE